MHPSVSAPANFFACLFCCISQLSKYIAIEADSPKELESPPVLESFWSKIPFEPGESFFAKNGDPNRQAKVAAVPLAWGLGACPPVRGTVTAGVLSLSTPSFQEGVSGLTPHGKAASPTACPLQALCSLTGGGGEEFG